MPAFLRPVLATDANKRFVSFSLISSQILDNANLSTGGMSYDFTTKIHTDYANLAINITKDMELRLCGVDILTSDISKPISDYIIIEINSAPGLDNYASLGEEQVQIVDNLYLKILQSLEKS